MSSFTRKLPSFLRRPHLGTFLTVVVAGQLVYVSFEAFKGSLIIPMTKLLGITNEQYGDLFSALGLAMFFYIPAGWVNNRFKIRTILLAWSAWRLITFLVVYLIPMNYSMLFAIAVTWGIWDAIGWPAVVNGVSFASKDSNTKGRGLAMGLLETIRRAMEFLMNAIIVAMILLFPAYSLTIIKWFAIAYALLLVPLILALVKFVPNNAIAHQEGTSDNIAALIGLFKVLMNPRVLLAGIAAMCVYWGYVNLFWSSSPYLQTVYHVSDGPAAAFGLFNTGLIGILAGFVAGLIADYIFKSSTMMMAVALGTITVASFIVLMLPNDKSAMWPSLVLLMLMAFGIFMGKAVILAPVAELHLPESINGSAMAVGSFLAYASIFWANKWNGRLLDTYKGQEYLAYQKVFWITLIVAAVGTICATILMIINKRVDAKVAIVQADGTATAEVAE